MEHLEMAALATRRASASGPRQRSGEQGSVPNAASARCSRSSRASVTSSAGVRSRVNRVDDREARWRRASGLGDASIGARRSVRSEPAAADADVDEPRAS